MSHGLAAAAPAATPERRPTADGTGAAAARGSGHIPEIDGLRGVAIALVVVYHIWFNRVSGGVDVFFLLSGMLITMSLTRSVERHGRVSFMAFYARIIRRIFPPAMAVLAATVVAAWLWLPEVRWRETMEDVAAAALYFVNMHLADNAVDYLAAQNAASPVQHYWSLAVQGQFYLLWPLVIVGTFLLSSLVGLRLRLGLTAVFAVILAGSLAYSVYLTAADQAYAYFNTWARMHEFALGGLLALALPHLRPGRWAKVVLGWLGLAALVACGMVFRSGDEFPGYAALWPTAAAALLILCVDSGSRIGADRLLRTAVLRRLGDLSYALYLWHWPILICYLAVTGRTVPSLTGGLLIIGVSVVLSVGTHWLLERRLPATGIGQRRTWGGFALGAGFLALALLSTTAWASAVSVQQEREQRAVAEAGAGGYPGAAVLSGGYGPEPAELPITPGPIAAKDDLPEVYDTGCHQEQADPEALACSFGAAAEDAEATIALVGGSHSAHWLPALQELAEDHSLRVVSMTKSACLFSADEQWNQGEPYTACHEWNDNVLAELAELSPDAVLTTSTRVGGGMEDTPEGYVAQWRALEELGLEVAAVRDTPWPMLDVPECVEEHGRDAPKCGRDRDEMYPDGPPNVAASDDLPDNVTLIDLTDYICDDGHCPSVVGNILVYRDNSHLTATYARTLAPYLEAELAPLL